MKSINITKVVSRNIIMDFVAKFQNIVGLNLTSYEKMINDAVKQCEDDLKLKGIKLKWFRYEMTQLTNGAIAVLLYGEQK